MQSMTFRYEGKQYKRVSKATARKLYDLGKTIHFFACKLCPFSHWTGLGYYTDREDARGQDFEAIVNAFEFYNTSWEEGYYASYYVEVT